jgi:thiaminase/transcriptional activator TenA
VLLGLLGGGLRDQAARDHPNPYAAWIDNYADPAFGEATKRVCALVDAAAQEASPATRTAMARAFKQATRFEWMFWDSAWRRESWPI